MIDKIKKIFNISAKKKRDNFFGLSSKEQIKIIKKATIESNRLQKELDKTYSERCANVYN